MVGIQRNYCSECGRYTCDCKCGTSCSSSPTTAPTVEVDEREEFSLQESIDTPEFLDLVCSWRDGVEDGALWSDIIGAITDYARDEVRAALASKPPAREAAERQSIGDDREFHRRLAECVDASHPDDPHDPADTLFALIAYIDTWAARRHAETVQTTPRVKEGCDCGCNDPVATDPIGMLEFLAGRFEHAGVSKAVAEVYAHDIRKILAAPAAGNTVQPKEES